MAPTPASMLLSAAAASGLLTLAWIRFARSRQIEDQPGQRRLHALPTPRGGGIAIALVMLAALGWVESAAVGASGLAWLAVGIGSFGLLGLLDDLLPVPTSVKFILQMLAATALVVGMAQGWMLGWAISIVLIVACAYVVNIWNFMDGSDGLIGVQALAIALAMAVWPGQSANLRLVALALAGACIGFLPFNLPKARVFLGDVGSHVLGASVFGLLLQACHEHVIGLAQALLMGSALLLDTGYTLLRRLLAGRRVWRAHREHLYQYAVRRGNSHVRVCAYYAGWTLVAIFLAWFGGKFRSSLVMSGLLVFSWLLGTLLYFGLRQHWLARGTHREMRHE